MTSWEVLLLIAVGALTLQLAFLSLAETALSRIDRIRAQVLYEEQRRGSAPLLYIVESPDRFSGYLNSVLLVMLACQISITAIVTYLTLRAFAPWVSLITLSCEACILYVFATVIPKTWAVQHTERAALVCAPVVKSLTAISLVKLISSPLITVANIILPGKGLRQGPFVYEQQILAIADNAAQEKAIEREEHKLIHSVIEFGTTVVREVMVPRPDMFTLAQFSLIDDAMKGVIQRGFSRIPVHGEDTDEIIGMVFAKDMMAAVFNNEGDTNIERLVKPTNFIPETKRVAPLLREMQQEKFHMAIVVDEYGNVAGLVTLEDLVEEVVGEITDEYDHDEQPPVVQTSKHEFRVDGRLTIDDVFEETNVRLPHGDWDTVGGLLINAFGRVPLRGEYVSIDGIGFEVTQMSGRRVERVRMVLPTTVVEDDENQ